MLDKNKAFKVETKQYKEGGSTNKVFFFYCSECESEIKAQSSQLKRHSGKCRRCTQLGIPYMHIYNELKNNHKKDADFNISFEYFLDIIKDCKCHYCEDTLIFNKHSKFNGLALSRAYQLNRKDNNLGYIENNLVSSCWECNRLKSDRFTYDEFIKLSPILKDIIKSRI